MQRVSEGVQKQPATKTVPEDGLSPVSPLGGNLVETPIECYLSRLGHRLCLPQSKEMAKVRTPYDFCLFHKVSRMSSFWIQPMGQRKDGKNSSAWIRRPILHTINVRAQRIVIVCLIKSHNSVRGSA